MTAASSRSLRAGNTACSGSWKSRVVDVPDILEPADGRNRPVGLAILDLVQPVLRAGVVRLGQQRAVAERPRADLGAALHPGEHPAAQQCGRNLVVVSFASVPQRRVRLVVPLELLAGVDVPLDARVAGHRPERIERSTDGGSRVVRARGDEHGRKVPVLAPLRVPVAVEAAAAGYVERQARWKVLRCRGRIELEDALGQQRRRRLRDLCFDARVVDRRVVEGELGRRDRAWGGRECVPLSRPRRGRRPPGRRTPPAPSACRCRRCAGLVPWSGNGRIGERVQEREAHTDIPSTGTAASTLQPSPTQVEGPDRALPDEHRALGRVVCGSHADRHHDVLPLMGRAVERRILAEQSRRDELRRLPAVVAGPLGRMPSG